MTVHRVGVAGWGLSRVVADRFPAKGTHLERYAAVLPAVEINSCFYRHHRPDTYARWAAGVPADFRFSVKLPKAITHEGGLREPEAILDRFLGEVTLLGEKLGCILVQLPPKLALDPAIAAAFLRALRARYPGPVALEPRHAAWSGSEGEALLREHRVARVAADPVRFPGGDRPAGFGELVYYRLHGSPRIYHSAYPAEYLDAVAGELRRARQGGAATWCIFDNTASGAAVPDALEMLERLEREA